jgi:hypothetical protein
LDKWETHDISKTPIGMKDFVDLNRGEREAQKEELIKA